MINVFSAERIFETNLLPGQSFFLYTIKELVQRLQNKIFILQVIFES